MTAIKIYRISDYEDVIAPIDMTFQDAIEFYEGITDYSAEDPHEYDDYGELPELLLLQYCVRLDCEGDETLPLAEYVAWAAVRGETLPILLSSEY